MNLGLHFSNYRPWGAGGLLGAFFVTALIAMCGCMGYVPGQQTYWDTKVQEMCKKDGGMIVYEPVVITQDQYRRLGGSAGLIPVPDEKSAKADAPFVSRTTEATLNEENPKVYRDETLYLRRADAKVLARSVRYWRVGGDIPSFGHPTYFSCPNQSEAVAAVRKVFLVEGNTK